MSPVSTAARSRVVATSTGTRDVLSAASTGTSTPCKGRPAQDAQARDRIKTPVTRRQVREVAWELILLRGMAMGPCPDLSRPPPTAGPSASVSLDLDQAQRAGCLDPRPAQGRPSNARGAVPPKDIAGFVFQFTGEVLVGSSPHRCELHGQRAGAVVFVQIDPLVDGVHLVLAGAEGDGR